MKRIIALLLCAALCLGLTGVLADDYATQPQKLGLQYFSKSGIKGTVEFDAAGSTPWAQAIAAVSGITLQLRAMDAAEAGFHMRLYVADEGEPRAMTEIYSVGGDTAWLQSEFLMGKTYAFPARGDMISALTSIGHENTTVYSTALRMLLMINEQQWDKNWAPQMESSYQLIDAWLTPYATNPEVMEIGNEKYMLVRYQVPAAQITVLMKQLLPAMLANQTLTKHVHDMMTDEQANLYMHEGYLAYYQQLIDELPISGTLILERMFDMHGEDVNTLMVFPIANESTGLREVTIIRGNEGTNVNAIGTDKTIQLDIPAVQTTENVTAGTLHVYRDNEKNIAAAFELKRVEEKFNDEKGRNCENYDWELKLAKTPDCGCSPDNEQCLEFAPTTVQMKAELYSKPGNDTAVTLKLELRMSSEDSTAGLTATIKSTSPWHVPEAPTGATVALNAMTEEQRAELRNDWLLNAVMVLGGMRPAQEPVDDVPLASATDVEVP